MNVQRLKSDFLLNNSVVAFMGAILLGTSLRSSSDKVPLPWSIEIPSAPDLLVVPLISALTIVSLFFAAASVNKRLQPFAMKTIQTMEPVLISLFVIAFTIGYLTTAAELPYQHWWAILLFFAGYALFLFVPIRYVAIHISDAIQSGNRRRK